MDMNKIHDALISYIREQTEKTSGELSKKFSAMNNNEIIRMMFSNYRGGNELTSRGLRLTQFGLQIMRQYFKGYEITMPDGDKLSQLHVLYLDKNAKMPYYCSQEGYVIYDHNLGIKLKLADGRVGILIEIENCDE